MGDVLDLNGGDYTILADTSETYWQVKDTSVNKDGTLTIEPGGKLLFDDEEDCGFASDWVGTFDVQGSAEAFCEIRSADVNPHYPFTMALGATGTITRCRIAGNGAYSCSNATAIILNNVYWGWLTYCSVDDVRRITGISTNILADADITALIETAVDEIDDYTGRKWYTGTASNEDHDYAGEGYVQTRYSPIQSITSLSFRGGESFTTKTAGAEADYYASPDDLRRGVIRLLSEPNEDYQALRVTYVYGEATTAGRIRRLCSMLAGRDALLATQVPQKVGVLRERIDLMDREVSRIKHQLGGKLRAWNPKERALETRYPRASQLARWRY